MENILRVECEQRQRIEDERFARDKERIEYLEEAVKKIGDVQVQLTEILRQQSEVMKEHACRLNDIERKPATMWDAIVKTAITAVVTFVITMFLSGKW